LSPFLFVLRPPPSSTLFPYTTLFRSDLRDPEVHHRLLHVTHVPGHPLPLDHPRRVGTRADRSGGAVDPGSAVRGAPTAETVALDHSLEAAALRAARDLHAAPDLEGVHRYLIAHRRRRALGDRELPKDCRCRLRTRHLRVAALRARRPLLLFRPEAQLDRLVAVLLRGAYLDDR